LKKGHYEDPETLVNQFHKVLASKLGGNSERVRLSYDNFTQRMTLKLEPNSMLILKKSFANLLGFFEEDFDESGDIVYKDRPDTIFFGPFDQNKRIDGKRMIDMQRGFYSLFVYCDLVEPVLVGDMKAPLLRTVHIKGKDGEMINKIFQNVQYAPLQKKHFETIEINIRDDAGKPVPFERGRVIVTLHFKQKKPSFF
jgi:hypothetical protein